MPSSAAADPAAPGAPLAWAHLAPGRTPSAFCACVRTGPHGACSPRTSRRCLGTHLAPRGTCLTADA
eukprot:292603-Pyramimonas_sp.AAC.1